MSKRKCCPLRKDDGKFGGYFLKERGQRRSKLKKSRKQWTRKRTKFLFIKIMILYVRMPLITKSNYVSCDNHSMLPMRLHDST